VGQQLFTFGAAFLGSAVESVEALTLVLAGAAWYAIAGLQVAPLPVLIGLVLLLAAQHIWFAVAEARREARSRPSPSPSPR
jgi:hypothetical protein